MSLFCYILNSKSIDRSIFPSIYPSIHPLVLYMYCILVLACDFEKFLKGAVLYNPDVMISFVFLGSFVEWPISIEILYLFNYWSIHLPINTVHIYINSNCGMWFWRNPQRCHTVFQILDWQFIQPQCCNDIINIWF